jgi:hypothetical protein
VASAFHPPYGEKMLRLCEDQGVKAAVVVRNGIEGSIAFPLLRAAKVLATRRTGSAGYERREFEFDSKKELGHDMMLEARVENPNAFDNARLIENHLRANASGSRPFDLRVDATCAGLKRAIDWILG